MGDSSAFSTLGSWALAFIIAQGVGPGECALPVWAGIKAYIGVIRTITTLDEIIWAWAIRRLIPIVRVIGRPITLTMGRASLLHLGLGGDTSAQL